YRTAILRSLDTQVAIARATAEQTARMVQEIDVVLTEQAQGNAVTDVTRFPFVHSLEVFGRDGRLLATTAPRGDTEVSYRQHPFFSTLEHAPPGTLYIGAPGHHDFYRTFDIGRAMRNRDGTFAGVVLARVPFEYLTDFYSSISVESSIRLVRDDGVVLARYPR